MRGFRALLLAALAAARIYAQSTVVIDQPALRAILRNETTLLDIPVSNSADHPIEADLSLAWLNPKGEESSAQHQVVTIPPGRSSLEFPMPLQALSIWTRLRCALSPVAGNRGAFTPMSAILALPQLAGYAFELHATFPGRAHRGQSFTVEAQAIHPLTRKPVVDPKYSAVMLVDKKKIPPVRTAVSPEGIASFTFDLPPSASPHSKDDADLEVTAIKGDFVQSVSRSVQIASRPTAQIQTDKPIYQPGQIVHFRAVVWNPEGHAAEGLEVKAGLVDDTGNTVHEAELTASEFGVIEADWPLAFGNCTWPTSAV